MRPMPRSSKCRASKKKVVMRKTCVERLEAFKLNGVEDPIEYEKPIPEVA